jgi:hypothetical protein
LVQTTVDPGGTTTVAGAGGEEPPPKLELHPPKPIAIPKQAATPAANPIDFTPMRNLPRSQRKTRPTPRR